jgi:hypothetical protein
VDGIEDPVPDIFIHPANETKVNAAPASDTFKSVAFPEVPTAPVAAEEAQLSSAGDGETTLHQAAKGNKPGMVRNVTVSHDKDFVEVRVEGSKPLQASASTFSNPERIIIDLADVRVRSPRRIAVNTGDVQTVDVAVFLVNPLVTRLTVDLLRASPYRVHASGNSLTVRIGRNRSRPGKCPEQVSAICGQQRFDSRIVQD